MWKKIMSGLLMAVHWLRLRLRQYGDDASQPASDGAKAAASPGKVLVVYFSVDRQYQARSRNDCQSRKCDDL